MGIGSLEFALADLRIREMQAHALRDGRSRAVKLNRQRVGARRLPIGGKGRA